LGAIVFGFLFFSTPVLFTRYSNKLVKISGGDAKMTFLKSSPIQANTNIFFPICGVYISTILGLTKI